MQYRFFNFVSTYFVVGFFCLATPQLSGAQPMYIGELRQYKMPELLTYSGKLGNSNIKGIAKPHKERQHGFYPIGWSRDDRFAFLVDYALHPVQDTHHVELVVQNVVFNDVVYSWRGNYITPDTLLEEPIVTDKSQDAIANDHVQAVWQRHYTHLRRKLNDLNIKQPANFNWLTGDSFKYESERYKLVSALDKHPVAGGVAAKITLSCSKGSRFLFIKNNTDEAIDKVEIHGTLISPYEARGVVLVELIFKGDTEKEPKRQLRLVGFDLVHNFEKEK